MSSKVKPIYASLYIKYIVDGAAYCMGSALPILHRFPVQCVLSSTDKQYAALSALLHS